MDLPANGRIYHPNAQAVRSREKVIKYCTKKEDYISNLDLAVLLQDSKGTRKAIGRKLLEKVPLSVII